MATLTLWCMNRVAHWPLDELKTALEGQTWFGKRNTVKLGCRQAYDRPADDSHEQTPCGALAHELNDWDEYFVPIVVKCIGDPEQFKKNWGNKENASAVDALLNAYPEFYDKREKWKEYWQLREQNVGMFTGTAGGLHVGLYDIVANEAANTGQAVIVGYSQDGLVARFLRYLDELLHPKEEHQKIAGFITVQAPNAGSPLADEKSEAQAAEGIFGVFSTLGGFPLWKGEARTHVGEFMHSLTAGPADTDRNVGRVDMRTVKDLIESAITDNADSDRNGPLLTARRWLSGVCPLGFKTAFNDLEPSEIDRPQRILERLHGWSPLVPHAAVIGIDNSLVDFALEVVVAAATKESPGRGLAQGFLRVAIRFMLRLFPRIRRVLAKAAAPYAQLTMSPRKAKKESANGRTITEAYWRGFEVPQGRGLRRVPAFAHDFVIPSASQVLYLNRDEPPKMFLGNWVNRSNHISGGDPKNKKSDLGAVLTVLRRLAKSVS